MKIILDTSLRGGKAQVNVTRPAGPSYGGRAEQLIRALRHGI